MHKAVKVLDIISGLLSSSWTLKERLYYAAEDKKSSICWGVLYPIAE